jgi:hypothetical protein
MIDTKDEDLLDFPFYSWQCITINLGRRDVDLVLPDEQSMLDLLTLLIYHTNTIDGSRDSANSIKYQIAMNRVYTKNKKPIDINPDIVP